MAPETDLPPHRTARFVPVAASRRVLPAEVAKFYAQKPQDASAAYDLGPWGSSGKDAKPSKTYRRRHDEADVLDHHETREEVERRPRIKSLKSGELFSKPDRRAAVLSWHMRRTGRGAPFEQVAGDESAATRDARARAKWWKQHHPEKMRIEDLPTTVARSDFDVEPPNLRWGDEAEALREDASDEIKAAYAKKAAANRRELDIKTAEEALQDACAAAAGPRGVEAAPAVAAALRQAASVGVPSDSEASMLAHFTAHDLERRREDERHQELRKQEREHRDTTAACVLPGEKIPWTLSRPRPLRETASIPWTLQLAAAASPRFLTTKCTRRGRGVVATRLRGISTSRRRDSSPRNVHVVAAAPPRPSPRNTHGVAATCRHGIYTS